RQDGRGPGGDGPLVERCRTGARGTVLPASCSCHGAKTDLTSTPTLSVRRPFPRSVAPDGPLGRWLVRCWLERQRDCRGCCRAAPTPSGGGSRRRATGTYGQRRGNAPTSGHCFIRGRRDSTHC